nr:MAG TPA: hypothetical protein [Bacteriophage sp.]
MNFLMSRFYGFFTPLNSKKIVERIYFGTTGVNSAKQIVTNGTTGTVFLFIIGYGASQNIYIVNHKVGGICALHSKSDITITHDVNTGVVTITTSQSYYCTVLKIL